MQDSGWLDMIQRKQFHLISMILKVIRTNHPPYLRNCVHFMRETRLVDSRLTRNDDMILIPRHKKSKFESCFAYLCPKIYNSYPIILNTDRSLNLQSKIKHYVKNVN